MLSNFGFFWFFNFVSLVSFFVSFFSSPVASLQVSYRRLQGSLCSQFIWLQTNHIGWLSEKQNSS